MVAAVGDIPPGGTCRFAQERARHRGVQSRRRVLRAQQPLSASRRQPVSGQQTGLVTDGPGNYRYLPPGRDHPLPLARLGVRHPHRPVLVRSHPRARPYTVSVQPGTRLVAGPYVAETVPVSVENDYGGGGVGVGEGMVGPAIALAAPRSCSIRRIDFDRLCNANLVRFCIIQTCIWLARRWSRGPLIASLARFRRVAGGCPMTGRWCRIRWEAHCYLLLLTMRLVGRTSGRPETWRRL